MKRLPMRKIREALRLRADGFSGRQVAQSLAVGRATISEYFRRADVEGLRWPLPADLSDAELERRLFPYSRGEARRAVPQPDWAYVHAELRRKGVTLSLADFRITGQRFHKLPDTYFINSRTVLCWLVPGLIYVSFWMISFSGCRVKSGVFLVRRMLSPLISIRCALWIMRSRIASAIVGSPIISCQPDMGSWAVMIVERRW